MPESRISSRKPVQFSGFSGGTMRDHAMLKIQQVLIREGCAMSQDGEWVWVDDLFALTHRTDAHTGGGLHAYRIGETIHLKDPYSLPCKDGLELEEFLEHLPVLVRFCRDAKRKMSPDVEPEAMTIGVDLV